MRVPRCIFDVCKLVFVLFSAWCVCDLCRVQRSRCKGVHWPMQLSTRSPPGPATRAFGLRQRSAEAALRRNRKKAKKGFGPLAAGGAPGAPGSGSEEFKLWAPSGGSSWQTAPEAPGRSSGSWQTWPEAPGGRSSGSWQIAPEAPRRVGRTGRMSERWLCGRAPRDQSTIASCIVVYTEHANGYMHTSIDSYPYAWIL
jgi:hypothetical protein